MSVPSGAVGFVLVSKEGRRDAHGEGFNPGSASINNIIRAAGE